MRKFSYELERLRGTILRPVIFSIVVSLALLALSYREVVINNLSIPVLAVGTPTLATSIFLSAKSFLIPSNVPLVALGPVSIFMAPIVMSFLISLLVTFPYILYSLVSYLQPALYPKERTAMYAFALPSLFLFYFGCAFGYFLIVPTTFSVLYSFAAPIGVIPYFSLDSFISSVFLLTMSVGMIFLLPVVMVLLTRLSIVPHEQWLLHWRGALLTALLFSAVVTPDGSGITMIFLFIPLMVLYGVGLIASWGSLRNKR